MWANPADITTQRKDYRFPSICRQTKRRVGLYHEPAGIVTPLRETDVPMDTLK